MATKAASSGAGGGGGDNSPARIDSDVAVHFLITGILTKSLVWTRRREAAALADIPAICDGARRPDGEEWLMDRLDMKAGASWAYLMAVAMAGMGPDRVAAWKAAIEEAAGGTQVAAAANGRRAERAVRLANRRAGR